MQPKAIFDFFRQINNVPRPSKKEEKMRQYLKGVAQQYNLDYKTDEVGNVLISAPATKGFENSDGIVVQGHMDMVCEEVKGLGFDFDNQPIETFVDGDWMKAKGTTLGADDGIGVAMALALVTDPNIQHGPIQCLFTMDEESGMTGAFALEPGFMQGKYLINLDSEDEGELFIGCAGGENTTATFHFNTVPLDQGFVVIKLEIDKLKGGHSGDEINKKRANAIKLMARFLYLESQKTNLKLIRFEGGNKHNAIPRYAEAVVAVPIDYKEKIRVDFNLFAADAEGEYYVQETDMTFLLQSEQLESPKVIENQVALNFIRALQAVHNGILEMNQSIEGLVETSSNLASVKQVDNSIQVVVSQRSSTDSALDNVRNTVAALFQLAGADVKFSDRYPGWKPDNTTKLLKVAVQAYSDRFGKQPVVRAIHAGLECGLFATKYPGMEMISFGPTLRNVHTPDEKLLIPTVDMAWNLLLDIVDKLK